MTASATISGATLLKAELQSPLILTVLLIIIASGALAYLYYTRRKPYDPKKKLSIIAIILTIILVIAVNMIIIRPGTIYGATLEGENLTITFYGTETITINICQANISLVPTSKALDMLKIRTNGLADPTSEIYMGYYKLEDGRKAQLIIWSKDSNQTLIVEYDDQVAMIGLRNVTQLYNTIQDLETQACTTK
ncbi:MAG: hypothetical protein F7C36_06860 [Desulfurococcales archaeon]|nr:hypothetical protein [Desulfurococcales archaeon]